MIGIPDRQWTQSVKAIVVLADGATATAEDIIEHVRTRIASYKKPREVEFVDELPRVGFAVDYDALDANSAEAATPEPRCSRDDGPLCRPGRAHRRPDDALSAPGPARELDAGTVWGGLEDDFHHFEVTLHHDGDHVTGLEMEALRWPWAPYPDAGRKLQKRSSAWSSRTGAPRDHHSRRDRSV